MIVMHHGIGGGRLQGGKANNLERFETVISGADLHLQGHTHTYDFFYNSTQYIDRKRNNKVDYSAAFCTTGHCIRWRESYGEEFRYKLTPKGFVLISLKHCKAGNFSL